MTSEALSIRARLSLRRRRCRLVVESSSGSRTWRFSAAVACRGARGTFERGAAESVLRYAKTFSGSWKRFLNN
jgi:hypothetical protein